jgi:hypothetical protein
MIPCALARALGALLVVACTPLRVSGPAPASIPAGIVWWPADSSEAIQALGGDLEGCLAARLRDVAPEILVVPQRAIRDALFPLLEPATQPETDQAFAELLAREDVRARLAGRGLRYLIAFAGGTRKEGWTPPIVCGAGPGGGGCFGFAWQSETTALNAAVWSLAAGTRVRRQGVTIEGTSIMPAFLLPVPIFARTGVEACRELGSRIATAIRDMEAARAGPR